MITDIPDFTPQPNTRDRILEVAERLFADEGYSRVSLRRITTEAGANMAAVHYYFRTKEALLKAIFETRAAPLTAERERLLAELESEGNAADIKAVLAAFLGPGIRLGRTPQGAVFNRLSAICSVDPNPTVKNIVFGVHDAVAEPFVRALRRACPDIDAREFFVRLQCVFGSMMYVRADNGRLNRLLEAPGNSAEDVDATLEMLLNFLTAGMRSPGLGAVAPSHT